MTALAAALLLLVSAVEGDIALSCRWVEAGELAVSVALVSGLPSGVEQAVRSGADVSIEYRIVVSAPRKLWFSRRLWKGSLVPSVRFDPVVGRYKLKLTLGGAVLMVKETDSAEDALSWLVSPPEVTIGLGIPVGRRVKVKARAVFSTTTVWLVFPKSKGTKWCVLSVPES